MKTTSSLHVALLLVLFTYAAEAQVATLISRQQGTNTPSQNTAIKDAHSAPASSPPQQQNRVAAKRDSQAPLLLFTALEGSTIFDLESTFRTLERCPNCREGNPLMRPFVKAGRPASYAFTTGVNLLAFYTSTKLRKQGKKWWYVPTLAYTGLHLWAGIQNTRIK